MNVTKIFETSKNKVVAVALGLILIAGSIALAMSGTFATDDFSWAASTQPAGYADETIVEVGVAVPAIRFAGVNTSNLNYAINDKIEVTYTRADAVDEDGELLPTSERNRFTVVPQSAGKTGFTYGSAVTGRVDTIHYWVKDNNNIASYDMDNNWTAIETGATKNWAEITGFTAKSGLDTNALDKIEWTSANPSVATYENGNIIGQAGKEGYAIIVGKFTDIWGFEQTISMMVIVGSPNNGVNATKIIIDTTDLDTIIRGTTVPLPVTVIIEPSNAAVQTVTWSSSNPAIAAVDPISGAITGVHVGEATITAILTNPDGSIITESYDVEVDRNDGVVGPDGNGDYWKPVGEPPHVWEKVGEDGRPLDGDKEYIHDKDADGPMSDTNPSTPVIKGEDGTFWAEEPTNIWTPVLPSGEFGGEDTKIWGGPDRKPGTADDEDVTKFGSGADENYWVSFGQNIYAQVRPHGGITELVGGGVDFDPTSSAVTPILDNRDRDGYFYYGPLTVAGETYYVGDKRSEAGGDGLVTSNPYPAAVDTSDEVYYLHPDGSMTTVKPGALPDGITKDTEGNYWKDNGDNTFTKVEPVDEYNYEPSSPEEIIWGGADKKPGTTDDKPVVTYGGKRYADLGNNVFIPVFDTTDTTNSNHGKLDKDNATTGGYGQILGGAGAHTPSTTPALKENTNDDTWYLEYPNGDKDIYGPDGKIDTPDDVRLTKITPEMDAETPPASDFDGNNDGYLNPDEKQAWEDAVEAGKVPDKAAEDVLKEKLTPGLITGGYRPTSAGVVEYAVIGDDAGHLSGGQYRTVIPYFINPEDPYVNGNNVVSSQRESLAEIALSQFVNDASDLANITFTTTHAPIGNLYTTGVKMAEVDATNIYVWYLPTYDEYKAAGGPNVFRPEFTVTATYTGAEGTASVTFAIHMQYKGSVSGI